MQVQPSGSWTPELSSVGGATPTTMTSPPPAPYLMGTLDGIAQMLSMPTDTLRSAIQQGSSIADLAQQKGVSLSSIAQYVKDQVQQQRTDQGQPPVDSTALDQTVNRVLNRHRHHGHGHGRRAAQAVTPPSSPSTTPTSGSSGLDVLA